MLLIFLITFIGLLMGKKHQNLFCVLITVVYCEYCDHGAFCAFSFSCAKRFLQSNNDGKVFY